MNAPLVGIRILAVEQLGAGTLRNQFFDDLGEDFIKKE